ncbi:protein maternal effect lethal 26, partial [Nephila pilipes]
KSTPINKNRSREVEPEVVKTEIMKDFEKAFESRQFCDITLKLKGGSVRAHKFVLAARSPVFKTLLEDTSCTGNASEIIINDLTKSVLINLLYYLYCGIIGTVQWDMLIQLYEVAGRYQVDSLKQNCRDVIVSNLSDKRACKVLQFADKHKDHELVKSVTSYMKNNFYKLRETDHWKLFREESPGLAFDVYKSVTD